MQFTINKINVEDQTINIVITNINQLELTIKPSYKDTIDYDTNHNPRWKIISSSKCYEEGSVVNINNPHELRKLKILG